MSDFIASLQAKGICRLIPQIGATGSWTIHMNKPATNGFLNHTEHSSTMGSSSGSAGGYGPYSGTTNPSQTSTIRASPTTLHIHLKRYPGDNIGLSIVAAQVREYLFISFGV